VGTGGGRGGTGLGSEGGRVAEGGGKGVREKGGYSGYKEGTKG